MTNAEAALVLVSASAARTDAEQHFERLRSCLVELLPVGTQIEHVGATSIPGCLTKGDLDLALRVHPGDFESAVAALSEHFEPNTGSAKTETFAAFVHRGAHPPTGIQLVVRDSEFDMFVRFRDLLRSDAGLLRRYNALKKAHAGKSMSIYREAKAEFIKSVLAGGSGATSPVRRSD